MATATGTVGSKNVSSGAGTQYDQSFMPSGAQRTSDAHGRYLDSVLRGRVFSAANQAGAALSNLSATCTGFCLNNPTGSGQWVAVLEVGGMQTSTASANANSGVQLAGGALSTTAVTHTTPLTVVSHPFGSTAVAVGKVDSAATLPAAPTAILNLWQASVSATAAVNSPALVWRDLGGLITLMPGTTLSFSNIGTAISVAAYMFWEEITLNAQYS